MEQLTTINLCVDCGQNYKAIWDTEKQEIQTT